MSLQRFTYGTNTSKVKVSNNINFQTGNVPDRVFHQREYRNMPNDNNDIDYNGVLQPR